MERDPWNDAEKQALREAVATADEILELVQTKLEGPYEHHHPALFRLIREWRKDTSDSQLF